MRTPSILHVYIKATILPFSEHTAEERLPEVASTGDGELAGSLLCFRRVDCGGVGGRRRCRRREFRLGDELQLGWYKLQNRWG